LRFLIDTCVVSEWKRKKPDPTVTRWLEALTSDEVYF